MSSGLVNSLLDIARVLAQFSEARTVGALRWNGTTYTGSEMGASDLAAAKWWGVLTAVAGMLEAQTSALSAKQKTYLDKLLFGGMGSLNDLALDEQRLGPQAVSANQELNLLRKSLFDALQAAGRVQDGP